MEREATVENNILWPTHYLAQKNYQDAVNLLNVEPTRPDLMYIWKVQVPDYSLRNLMGATYFARRRWFVTNPYAVTNATRERLRPIAPGYIEFEWEKWTEPQPWLNLLALWTPLWLEKLLGQPLASLQLLVDLADHVRTRELLPLDEKSRTTTVLLTSAESLLKWPIHYLTLLSRESDHPLKEIRPQAVVLWEQQKIRADYLTRCATNLLPTQKLVRELHAELQQQLTLLHWNKHVTLKTDVIANESQQPKKPRWIQQVQEPLKAITQVDDKKRQKTAHEELETKMAKRCKEERRE